MADNAHAHGSHHIIPVPTLIVTFFKLLILMILTIVFAFVPYWFPFFAQDNFWIRLLNNSVALGIATIKAVLVLQIFMGVKYATKLTQLYAIMGFIWMTLLAVTLCDYATRRFEPVPNWEGAKVSPITEMEIPVTGQREIPRQSYVQPHGIGR